MSELLENIGARTRLAGTNTLEILLFSLGTDARTGRRETFGINVSKVREVMCTPTITAAPDMPASIEGMVSLRGTLVPVIDLAKYACIGTDLPREIMIVTEYNDHTQGFLVEAVNTILRLDWSQMYVPPSTLVAKLGGLVKAVTELPDGELVMMLDVEKVLSETSGDDDSDVLKTIAPIARLGMTVLYVDDSAVARSQIARTLEALGVNGIVAINGRAAWEILERLAQEARSTGRRAGDLVQAVLTDIEMPDMDGYILTKKIKSDPRFEGIPILMHSSLSGMFNQQRGLSVGVDEYVPKFDPQRLSVTLRRLLGESTDAHVV